MVTCPNCGKALDDGMKFCDACGTQLPTGVACPTCGAANPAGYAFCQACGASMAVAAAQPAPETQQEVAEPVVEEKKSFKKLFIFGGIGLAAVIGIIVLLCVLLSGAKKPNVALYIKDGQIVYNPFDKAEAFEVSDNLFDIDDFSAEHQYGSMIGYSISFNKKCTVMFYPDRITYDSQTGDRTFTLYYREVKDPDADPVKIDSGIQGYVLNEKGDKVLYQKEDALYIHDLENRTKIDEDIYNVYYDKKLSKIVYTTREEVGSGENKKYVKDLYVWEEDTDKVKLASEISSVYVAADYEEKESDLSTVYYTKEEGTGENAETLLYKLTPGKDDKVKIAEDVESVIAVYTSGKVYYTTSKKTEKTYMDFVDDDMASSDAVMTEPVQPIRSNYSSTAEYNTAYNRYWDVDYPAWSAKLQRDSVREYLKNEKYTQYSYVLHCFDGETDVVVTEEMTRSYADDEAAEKEVLLITTAKAGAAKKIKMSEVQGSYDVYNFVYNSQNETEAKMNLVVDTQLTAIEQKKGSNYNLAADGSVLYFLDDINEEKHTGNLYKITINKGVVGTREKLDGNVFYSYMGLVFDTSIRYIKNYKEETNKGDLYIDGKSIDSDVYVYSVSETYNDTLTYYTDYNSEKSEGTLKQYKDEQVIKIADDVSSYTVLPEGDILYLVDFSSTRYKGTLYHYVDGKANKLDDDVSAIIPIYYNED